MRRLSSARCQLLPKSSISSATFARSASALAPERSNSALCSAHRTKSVSYRLVSLAMLFLEYHCGPESPARSSDFVLAPRGISPIARNSGGIVKPWTKTENATTAKADRDDFRAPGKFHRQAQSQGERERAAQSTPKQSMLMPHGHPQ